MKKNRWIVISVIVIYIIIRIILITTASHYWNSLPEIIIQLTFNEAANVILVSSILIYILFKTEKTLKNSDKLIFINFITCISLVAGLNMWKYIIMSIFYNQSYSIIRVATVALLSIVIPTSLLVYEMTNKTKSNVSI